MFFSCVCVYNFRCDEHERMVNWSVPKNAFHGTLSVPCPLSSAGPNVSEVRDNEATLLFVLFLFVDVSIHSQCVCVCVSGDEYWNRV